MVYLALENDKVTERSSVPRLDHVSVFGVSASRSALALVSFRFSWLGIGAEDASIRVPPVVSFCSVVFSPFVVALALASSTAARQV